MLKRLLIAAGLVIVAGAWAEEPQLNEYQVKAAFLLNFANFVEWPQGTFAGTDDRFSVCVLGKNPFGQNLDVLAKRKTAEGRLFDVRQIPGVKESAGCQIVFVSSSERLRYRVIIEGLKSGILTVGETDDFAEQGGAMELVVVEGKVQIKIDARAAKDRNLRVSSHLLSLAKSARQ
jgi:YfiR/HmsC-like